MSWICKVIEVLEKSVVVENLNGKVMTIPKIDGVDFVKDEVVELDIEISNKSN